MAKWVRFSHQGERGFGLLRNGFVHVHEGDLFGRSRELEHSLALSQVELLTPCEPGKMLGLWNNFRARAAKEGWSKPVHPLYFLKASSSFQPSGHPIRRPAGYSGPVVFEGELGIVIGTSCHQASVNEADECIFGYTCVNDVTARDILRADPSFPQWTRAKSFDGFGVFGPAIVTGVEPVGLRVRTLVNGELKQNYPLSDMFFSPRDIVSRLSWDMTLNPGDLIACGTSVGSEAMPAGCTVEVVIDGVGRLANTFQA